MDEDQIMEKYFTKKEFERFELKRRLHPNKYVILCQNINPTLRKDIDESFFYVYFTDYFVRYYVRTEKQLRFQERLLPLWLISSNSPNKNCLLYQLPREISRYIIGQFI
jgi:hypothetical protein